MRERRKGLERNGVVRPEQEPLVGHTHDSSARTNARTLLDVQKTINGGVALRRGPITRIGREPNALPHKVELEEASHHPARVGSGRDDDFSVVLAIGQGIVSLGTYTHAAVRSRKTCVTHAHGRAIFIPIIVQGALAIAIAGPHGGDISAIRETGVPHGLACALVAAVLRARQPFAGLSSEANRTLAETGRVLTYSHAGAFHGGVTHGRRSWLRSP
mmetsp:Transcript_25850/g.48690  ORF Transcript_25850/g.48690 Transcript_25850/m.48690 type:complete len:216 (-) Transcript_25850:420-1067(-)